VGLASKDPTIGSLPFTPVINSPRPWRRHWLGSIDVKSRQPDCICALWQPCSISQQVLTSLFQFVQC